MSLEKDGLAHNGKKKSVKRSRRLSCTPLCPTEKKMKKRAKLLDGMPKPRRLNCEQAALYSTPQQPMKKKQITSPFEGSGRKFVKDLSRIMSSEKGLTGEKKRAKKT